MDDAVLIVIAIILIIAYFCFAIRSLFFVRKQITMSLIDLLSFETFGFLATIVWSYSVILFLVICFILMVWSVILLIMFDKNEKRREKILHMDSNKVVIQQGGIILEIGNENKKDYIATNYMNRIFDDEKES